jgi:hypothetical protein
MSKKAKNRGKRENRDGEQGTCRILRCPNDRRKLSEVCASCSAAGTRARKKGPQWVVQRQNTLEKWQNRMVYEATEKTPTKEFKNAVRRLPQNQKERKAQ